MNKENFKNIWTVIKILVFLSLFVKTSYEYAQGKQPDNFTVMMVLIMYMWMNEKINSEK
jgi:hypothetical protein